MAKNKTIDTDENVLDFIEKNVNSPQKKADSLRLIDTMSEITGYPPRLWGPGIIGFGSYHYRYESGHEGDAPRLGFSPRKAAFSLYVFTGLPEHEHLLTGLGKFTMGKACIYVKKLEDIDMTVLIKLMKASLDYLKKKYP